MQIPLLLQKYSGIIGALVIWLFLVGYPFLHRDLGFLKETISALGEKKKNVFIAITTSLLVANIFQLIFLVYLQDKYAMGPDSYGSISYLMMCLTAFLATIFAPKYNPNLHFLSAVGYFFAVPATMASIGYQISSYSNLIFYISTLLTLIYIFVTLFALKKFGKTSAVLEVFCLFTISLWTICITFY